ncbi:hypothetical protein EMIHUDRAFT_257567, partial [Emiliania huxleyi CCMP1516]|uniref:Uncharacterized protein n=2 Tax=Emiliania huxleyi TaxID=2903 RepID=A0A0D3IIA3_EMIH1
MGMARTCSYDRDRGRGTPAADGAGAQAPATVVLPGRGGAADPGMAPIARNWRTQVIKPGYATIEVDLKHVQAAERSYIERTAPKKKDPTKEQLAARAAARKAKKARQKARRAEEAGERAASEAERADYPHAQLRENVEFVMEGLEAATQAARNHR